jgi:hypothetical protein
MNETVKKQKIIDPKTGELIETSTPNKVQSE